MAGRMIEIEARDGGRFNGYLAVPDAGSGPGLSPRRLGAKFGSENETLTVNQLPSHRHDWNVTDGVPVNTSPLNAALVNDPDFSAWLEKRTPAGRWGNVEELVGACIFLSSAASSFVNGHTLYVDGGITASL